MLDRIWDFREALWCLLDSRKSKITFKLLESCMKIYRKNILEWQSDYFRHTLAITATIIQGATN